MRSTAPDLVGFSGLGLSALDQRIDAADQAVEPFGNTGLHFVLTGQPGDVFLKRFGLEKRISIARRGLHGVID